MNVPSLSVVMGVHNCGADLPATLQSVLEQTDVDLEFIVVNDGSTDQTRQILESYSERHPCMRVLESTSNLGLTEALILGCAAARGRYIARQDAGDRSIPGRFARQLFWLDTHPQAVMVSCHTQFTGLYGEPLFERRISASELTDTLRDGINGDFLGPTHHGSVMMRSAAYHRAGGYRQPFVVAQDLDLWLRLVELGDIGVVDMIGYESQASPTGISAQRAGLQMQLAALAGDLARARRNGEDEAPILEGYRSLDHESSDRSGLFSERYRYAAYTYFLGRCVGASNPSVARRYFLTGLARCPWHARSWYGLLSSAFR